MFESVQLKTLRDGKLENVKFKTLHDNSLVEVDLKRHVPPPVPLWTAVTTRLMINGQTYEGRAYEVPELAKVIHTVEVSGLTPDTVYNFALPDNPTTVYTTFKDDPSTSMVVHWQTDPLVSPYGYYPNPSNAFKFKTLPASLDDNSVTIMSGGDIYQSDSQLGKLQGIFDVIANRRPDVFVIAGDIAYANNQWRHRGRWHTFWDEWFQRVVDPNEPITPLVVGIGNHEIGDGTNLTQWEGERYDFDTQTLGENTWFAAQFAFPSNGAYGVIDVGDYLSLVMLDTEHASPQIRGNDEQTYWLQDTLNARTSVKHVIPFCHYPSYPASSTFTAYRAARIRNNWHPLFEAHGGIKVVFEHHDHVYKRTVPILYNGGDPIEHPDGIRYLGDGAMGVAIRDGWNPNTTWYLEESIVSTYVQAESGTPDPLDGQPGYDSTIEEAWHMYETVLENDKRTINTLNILGDGQGTVYHTLVQEVDHV